MGTHAHQRPSLAVSEQGAGSPAVLLHGFTQNARCWSTFAEQLSVDHRCELVDLPGHGGSGAAGGDCWAAARAVLDAAGAGTYVGYSMGGRIALHAALLEPSQVRRIVLIGAHPGIEDPDARRARRRADGETADRLEAVGLPQFLDEWMASPLFADLDVDRAQVEQRLTNRADAMAAALRALGTGAQEPLWDRLPELEQPTLVLAGADDDKFATLGGRMADTIGANATARTVPDASHAVHLSQPDATVGIVRAWLADVSR